MTQSEVMARSRVLVLLDGASKAPGTLGLAILLLLEVSGVFCLVALAELVLFWSAVELWHHKCVLHGHTLLFLQYVRILLMSG
jgi:hypothetical protein